VRFVLGTGVTASPELSDLWLGGDTDLERAKECGKPTAEQLSLFLEATQEFGLSGRIRAFYVESMTPTLRGFAISEVCATGPMAPLEGMVAVMNGVGRRTLPHEFGHVLLNVRAGAHSVLSSNIMHISPGATGEDLVAPGQCRIIYNRA